MDGALHDRYDVWQDIHWQPIKSQYKLWVMARPLGCCIQFWPYWEKDIASRVDRNWSGNKSFCCCLFITILATSSTFKLIFLKNNLFASLQLLLKSKDVAGNVTVGASCMENLPLSKWWRKTRFIGYWGGRGGGGYFHTFLFPANRVLNHPAQDLLCNGTKAWLVKEISESFKEYVTHKIAFFDPPSYFAIFFSNPTPSCVIH